MVISYFFVLQNLTISVLTTLQNAYKLEANAIGMSMVKYHQNLVNLEKQLSLQNTTKTLIINQTEATDQICILDHMKDFYETFFG